MSLTSTYIEGSIRQLQGYYYFVQKNGNYVLDITQFAQKNQETYKNVYSMEIQDMGSDFVRAYIHGFYLHIFILSIVTDPLLLFELKLKEI